MCFRNPSCGRGSPEPYRDRRKAYVTCAKQSRPAAICKTSIRPILTYRSLFSCEKRREAEIAAEAGISEAAYKRYEAHQDPDINTHVKIDQALKRLGGKHPNAE
jgi:hypothetical protein